MENIVFKRLGIWRTLKSRWIRLILGICSAVFIYELPNLLHFQRYIEFKKFLFIWCTGNWNIIVSIAFLLIIVFYFVVISRTKINKLESPKIDKLNRKYFVDKLAEVINENNHSKINHLARIAITGDWGVGKTNVLEHLAHKLCYDSNRNTENKWRVAWVRPWQSENKQQAWQEFADAIRSAIGVKTLLERVLANNPLFRWMVSLIPKVGLNRELIDFASGKITCEDLSDIAAKINNSIKKNLGNKIKLLVLVDDLERADPEIIKNWLPIIARLDRIENCQFVFALDPERVAAAFGEKIHEAHTSKGFLDKVFDLVIPLPEPRQEDVADMILEMAKESQCTKLQNFLKNELFQVIQVISSNPRTALKFLNQARTKEIMYLHDNISDDKASLLFIFHLIEIEFPGFLKAISLHKTLDLITSFYANFIPPDDDSLDMGFYELDETLLSSNIITLNKERATHLERFKQLLSLVKMTLYETPEQKKIYLAITWAVSDHIRLDLLNPVQMDILLEKWDNMVTGESIDMLINKLQLSKYNPSVSNIKKQLLDCVVSNLFVCLRESDMTKGKIADLEKKITRNKDNQKYLDYVFIKIIEHLIDNMNEVDENKILEIYEFLERTIMHISDNTVDRAIHTLSMIYMFNPDNKQRIKTEDTYDIKLLNKLKKHKHQCKINN